MTESRTDLLWFCPGCFASEENGSCNHTCDANYCYNCGYPSTIQIPRYAIESIRQQASWVGSRYYPNSEDKQIRLELKYLRGQIPDHPTDKFEIIDPNTSKLPSEPDVDYVYLQIERLSIKSKVSTWYQLPKDYTKEQYNVAKTYLRSAIPTSSHYWSPKDAES